MKISVGLIRRSVGMIVLAALLMLSSCMPPDIRKPVSSGPPGSVSLTAAEITPTTVSLSWLVSDGRTGVTYEIYRDGGLSEALAETTYLSAGLEPERTYQFYITAKDAEGGMITSNTVTVRTLPISSPASATPEAVFQPVQSAPASVVESSAPVVVPAESAPAVSSFPVSSAPVSSANTSSISAKPPSSSRSSSKTPSSGASSVAVSSAASAVSSSASSKPLTKAGKIVAGYYASWSAYSGYTPLSVPAGKLTHLQYAFARIGDDLRIEMGDPAVDPANFKKLVELKKAYPHLKTSISIGGWTWSGLFSDAALTDARRTAFADSVVEFLVRHRFDGVDLDWEYPVSGGLASNSKRPEDRTNFTLLLKKLREKLDAQESRDGKRYLLSIAGGAGGTYIKNTDLKAVSGYLDYATIMTYDLHGSWDDYTDFNAPLRTPKAPSPQYKISVADAVEGWLTAGFPASKLVLGVPFYGYLYNGVTGGSEGLHGRFAKAGSISYDKVTQTYLSNPAYTRFVHPEAQVPWLFGGTTFISYDDAASVTAKAAYVVDTRLAGTCVWELSQNKSGVLLDAIYTTLYPSE